MQCSGPSRCLRRKILRGTALARQIEKLSFFHDSKSSQITSIYYDQLDQDELANRVAHINILTGTKFKESTLKLNLQTRNREDVMIVHCQGRIVYRDEAAALSRLVGQMQTGARCCSILAASVSSTARAWVNLCFCIPGRNSGMRS
jgi:hypothetical protein